MPMLDMPLAELKEYGGTNPCPEDHRIFWKEALEEMSGVKPELELRRAELTFPNVECYDLYFTGVRGARIYAKYMLPQNRERPCPAVLSFHGYSGSSGDWFGLLPFVQAGFAVAAIDCRGQGGQSVDVGGVKGNTLEGHIIRGLDDTKENLLFRNIFLDTAQLAGIVIGMDEIDSRRVYATGGSQGGGLTLACAALEPRISKISVLYPFLTDYQRAWEMDMTQHAYKELRDYFRRFDPLHEREEEIFKTLGYIDVQHLARNIQADVLFGATLMDNACPPSTQFAAFNKIRSNKELLVYPDFAHELPPGFQDRTLGFFLD